jgi:hypothetical protein
LSKLREEEKIIFVKESFAEERRACKKIRGREEEEYFGKCMYRM